MKLYKDYNSNVNKMYINEDKVNNDMKYAKISKISNIKPIEERTEKIIHLTILNSDIELFTTKIYTDIVIERVKVIITTREYWFT